MNRPRSFAPSAAPFIAILVAALAGPLAATGPSPSFRRVVVVSFDGAGGLALAREAERGTLGPDGFAKALQSGLSAERLEEVTPTLTSVSHASLSAGALPSATGIVANTFHPATAPLLARKSGFETESEVETIWEAAARQGKRVASLAWPGASQAGPRTRTAVEVRWVDGTTKPFTWKSAPGAAPADALFALPPEQPSFSPPKILPVGASAPAGSLLDPVQFVAVDSTDDGRRNYDLVLVVRKDGSVAARGRAGEWFALSDRRGEDQGDRDVLVGRWCKVLALAPDLSSARIYFGVEGRTLASPDDFRRTLDREAGFWPGSPDEGLLGDEEGLHTFVEQSARFFRFFSKAFGVADRRGDWDLLLAYVPVVDEAEHVLLLSDPRQLGYTPERAEQSAAALHEIWRLADETAAGYLRFASRGDVVLVSDHGMLPVARSFLIQEDLRRRGFLQAEKDPRGRLRTAPRSSVDAVPAGGLAYVVVNRAGLLEGGTVGPEAGPLVERVAAELRAERDGTGRPVFTSVLTRREARAFGLDHPNAGDLVLIAANGVTFRRGFTEREDEPLLVPAEPPGQHGFGPDPELDGIFFHVGDGIRPERLRLFRSIDVAPRIAERLGIAPPGARP